MSEKNIIFLNQDASYESLLQIYKLKVIVVLYEPPRGKTNNVVSEQVRHKPTWTSTEKS